MIAPARSNAENMAAMQDIHCAPEGGIDNSMNVTNSGVSAPDCDCRTNTGHGVGVNSNRALLLDQAQRKFGAVAVGEAPICDRSAGAAGAVRDRSFVLPRPAANRLAVQPCRLDLSSSLTPARWEAKIMARQFGASNGCGVAVSSVTRLKPRRNHQAIEIAALSVRLRGFSAGGLASCVRVRVCAYAYMCARENPVTLKPFNKIISIHAVSGFSAVTRRFQFETMRQGLPSGGGFAPIRNILGGGYAALAAGSSPHDLGSAVQVRSSTLMRGRGGENFGDFGAAASALGIDRDQAHRSERNGGIQPFSGCASGRVGRVMLEGWPVGRGNASFQGIERKPVRLGRSDQRAARAPWATCPASKAAPADRAVPPPHAPISAPPSPSTLAQYRVRIWIGFPADLIRGNEATGEKRRQTGVAMIGSGLGSAPCVPASGDGGAGRAGAFGEMPRRRFHASGRPCYVN